MKQYKLGISVYTGFKCSDGTMRYIDDAILVTRSEEELIALGATPIDDKPECECVKNSSGEWKMYSLNSDGQCIHCGRQIGPKPEKIEMPEVNITKYGIVHSKEIKNWMQQITEAVNSLKGE